MKLFAALALLVSGFSAIASLENLVEVNEQRIISGAVVDNIISAIEDLSQSIKDYGLDPLYVKNETASYGLPVPVIFNIAGQVEELRSNGLSNIVISNIDFNLLTLRLTFDIVMPLISATVDSASVKAVVFGKEYDASIRGGIAIQRIRVRGNANVSIIGGISVRSLAINFNLGGIISNLDLVIQGTDYTSRLATFLGITIPATLAAFESEVNELISIVALELINENLLTRGKVSNYV